MGFRKWLRGAFPPFEGIKDLLAREDEMPFASEEGKDMPANVTVTYRYACGHELVGHAYKPLADDDEPREQVRVSERDCPSCRGLEGDWRISGTFDPEKDVAEGAPKKIKVKSTKNVGEAPRPEVPRPDASKGTGPSGSSPTTQPCGHEYDPAKWKSCPKCYAEGKR